MNDSESLIKNNEDVATEKLTKEDKEWQKVAEEIEEQGPPKEEGKFDSYASRLSGYLLGTEAENPKTLERLYQDHEAIRAKYNLPDINAYKDLSEYERFLRKIAKDNDVQITSRIECGSFFVENPIASGVNLSDDKKVGLVIDKSGRRDYANSLTVLEHELIHALQNKRYPQMPIEVKEYEAYISSLNTKALALALEKYPDLGILKGFFMKVGASVDNWYVRKSKEEGREIKPVWDNVEYFQKIDAEK